MLSQLRNRTYEGHGLDRSLRDKGGAMIIDEDIALSTLVRDSG